MREAGDGFALDWDWVLVDFLMKGLTERNHVVVRNRVSGLYAWIGVEPEAHTIEEMKTGEIDEPGPTWCFLSPEKDRGSKNPLESSHQTSVVRPVFGRAERNRASVLQNRNGLFGLSVEEREWKPRWVLGGLVHKANHSRDAL